MAISLAPSPIARVTQSFFKFRIAVTILAFCEGDARQHIVESTSTHNSRKEVNKVGSSSTSAKVPPSITITLCATLPALISWVEEVNRSTNASLPSSFERTTTVE